MSDGINRETPLTVAALMEALSAFPPEAPVFCSGEFTVAVTGAQAARVYESSSPMSGYQDDYDPDAEPNAVLLV